MKHDSLPAVIEHGIAELRGAFPRVSLCHAALRSWREGTQPRYSLWLDIRWPQHQSVLSGPTRASAEEAVQAGFARAADRLHASP